MLKQTHDSKWVTVVLQKTRNWYQHLACSYMPQHKSLNQDKGGKCMNREKQSFQMLDGSGIKVWNNANDSTFLLVCTLFIWWNIMRAVGLWVRKMTTYNIYLRFLFELDFILKFLFCFSIDNYLSDSRSLLSLCNSRPKQPDSCAITRKQQICFVTKVAIWW